MSKFLCEEPPFSHGFSDTAAEGLVYPIQHALYFKEWNVERGFMPKKKRKCENNACHCLSDDSGYCSEECHDADHGDEDCFCGHDACELKHHHSGLKPETEIAIPR